MPCVTSWQEGRRRGRNLTGELLHPPFGGHPRHCWPPTTGTIRDICDTRNKIPLHNRKDNVDKIGRSAASARRSFAERHVELQAAGPIFWCRCVAALDAASRRKT